MSIWKSTGDESKTFSNRFFPLMQLGLADDNQFYGDLRTAMLDFFAAMPRDAAGAAAYANFIRMALGGAQLDFELSDDDFTSLLLGGVTKRWTALADITREANYFGSMSFVSSVKNGTFTDKTANENLVWSGGNLTITETGGYDRLILPGVVLARINWHVVGSDVTLIIAPSAAGKADGGTIVLKSQTTRNIDAILTSDGRALLAEDIKVNVLTLTGTLSDDRITGSSSWNYWNDTISGMGGNDTINAGEGDNIVDAGGGNDEIFTLTGNDTLTGGRGNDVLSDSYGNELIFYDRGDGHDTIVNVWGEDTIKFGAGIARGDVAFRLAGADVLVTIAASQTSATNGGSILIKNQTNIDQDIETFLFVDGSKITMEQIKTALLTLTGTSSGDRLTGSSIWNYWNDTITGGGGNDTLEGGSGDDTFVFSIGHGHDLVSDFDVSGNDQLQISNKLFQNWDAILKRTMQVGNDLLITTSATSSIRLSNVTLSSFGSDDVRLVA